MALVADDETPRTVRVHRDGAVARITLSNPRRKNAIGDAGWTELRDACDWVAHSGVRAVVVTGDGTDFCAGADLSQSGDRHSLANMRIVNEACLALHRLPLPAVARVDGYAVGAGMNLALACDFVVASDRARFSQIFVRRGLSVDFGGSWILPRLVGLHRAKELVMLGDIVPADELATLGVVRDVVAPADLDATVERLVDRLVAGPPLALAQSKRLLHDSYEIGLERALEDEARVQAVNLASEDAVEAGNAFFEKREPRFQGR
ncbi:MAG: enoyl-CoA hydratase [Nocardioides sp.]|nr:enoyl-CoA hydratase [Nocardioides sp.]